MSRQIQYALFMIFVGLTLGIAGALLCIVRNGWSLDVQSVAPGAIFGLLGGVLACVFQFFRLFSSMSDNQTQNPAVFLVRRVERWVVRGIRFCQRMFSRQD